MKKYQINIILILLISIFFQLYFINKVPLGIKEFDSFNGLTIDGILENFPFKTISSNITPQEFIARSIVNSPYELRIVNSIFFIISILIIAVFNPVFSLFILLSPNFNIYGSISSVGVIIIFYALLILYFKNKKSFHHIFILSILLMILEFINPLNLNFYNKDLLTTIVKFLSPDYNFIYIVTLLFLFLVPFLKFFNVESIKFENFDYIENGKYMVISVLLIILDMVIHNFFSSVLVILSILYVLSNSFTCLKKSLQFFIIVVFFLNFFISNYNIIDKTPWEIHDSEFQKVADFIKNKDVDFILTKDWTYDIFQYLTGKKIIKFPQIDKNNGNIEKIKSLISQILNKNFHNFIFLYHEEDDDGSAQTSKLIFELIKKRDISIKLIKKSGLFSIYLCKNLKNGGSSY